MTAYVKLSCDEVRKMIPYMLICETTSSAIWGTGRRRRMMRETFTAYERERIHVLRAQAHKWALTTGVPQEGVMMAIETFDLWRKLGDFCASL